ncbi:MAG: hypothetical protein Q8P13_00705 [bacterium]|nr:hypothetical protein [bacterium]
MKNRNLWLVVAAGVVLVGLFYYLQPKSENKSQNPSNQSEEQKTSPKTFEWTIQGKKLLSGQETLKVTEGEEVSLKVSADEADELHLHGYDVAVDLEPGETVELKVKADKTGRFVIELEEAKVDLGALEVSPK